MAMRRCRGLRIRKLIRRLAVGAIVDDRAEAARRDIGEVSLNKLRSNRDIRLELNDLDHETSSGIEPASQQKKLLAEA
jgi:hypothetical protein